MVLPRWFRGGLLVVVAMQNVCIIHPSHRLSEWIAGGTYLRDCAHSTANVRPHSFPAGRFPHHVVQQHVRAASVPAEWMDAAAETSN